MKTKNKKQFDIIEAAVEPENVQYELAFFCNGKFYGEKESHGFVEPVLLDYQVPTCEEPVMSWNKAKMSFELWQQVVAFMMWTFKEHDSEGIITLFYDSETDTWAAWAPPQEGRGMTVEIDDKSTDYDEQRNAITGQLLGSVHHHCNIGPSPSSTDIDDEEDYDGFHITLGNLKSPALTTHLRATLDKKTFPFILEDIVDTSFVNQGPMPASVTAKWKDTALCYPWEIEFPEQWKDNFTKVKTAIGFQNNRIGGGYYGGQSYGYDHERDWEDWRVKKINNNSPKTIQGPTQQTQGMIHTP
jgi:hypothetical protein